MKFFIGIVCILFFSASVQAHCTYKVRVVDYPPLYSVDEEGEWQGFTIDITKALLAEVGCRAQYVEIPWKRALFQLDQGTLDMMMNVSRTAKRAKYLYLIGPIQQEKMVLTLPKNETIKLGSFNNYKQIAKPIGLLRGAYYGEKFSQAVAEDPALKAKFIRANSTDDNVNNLLNKRISGFVSEEFNAYYRLKKLGNNFKIHPTAFYSSDVYYGVSKASVSENQAQALQQAFLRLSKRGVFEDISLKYRRAP